MSPQILVVSFKFNISVEEYVQALKPLVNEILNVPGLRWKIWLINEAQRTAGGLYLFDDLSYVRSFLASPLIVSLRQKPAFTDVLVMPFDVLDAETKATHGPLGVGVRV